MSHASAAGQRDVKHQRELRCGCHRLLARLEGRRLELRCPRCKQRVTLTLEGSAEEIEIYVNPPEIASQGGQTAGAWGKGRKR